MKLVGIVGTNSNLSTNRKLLQFIKKNYSEMVTVEICEIKDLPAFNEPEDASIPQGIQELSNQIEAAEGVVISTPEYDHTIPAALKSLLEWLSYTTRPLIDKPVMVIGASHGNLGSSRAQAHLRQILDAPELKARIMPSAEFLLGNSLTAFDEEGNLVNKEKEEELTECLEEFLLFVKLTNQLLEDHSFQRSKNKTYTWEQIADGGKSE